MKSLIAGFIILLYIIFIVFYKINARDYESNYLYAINYMESTDDKLNEAAQFIGSHLNIKNRSELLSAIEHDSTYSKVSYEYGKDDTIIPHKNLLFHFDSLGNFQKLSLYKMYSFSTLDTSQENYSPIISYIFQHNNYDNINWGRLHPIWIIFLFAVGLIIVINTILVFIKKKRDYIISIIILLVIVLLINLIHLVVNYQSLLFRNADMMINTLQMPSTRVLLKIMGLLSHYNALIVDVSLFCSTAIIVSVFIYKKRTWKEA